jgi:hypothetical protein
MNIQKNEPHGISIRDIIFPFNDEFHEKWTWACLGIINETDAPFP